MPKENKLVFELKDIKLVRFMCNDCKSVQAFALDKWKTEPANCMNCQGKWNIQRLETDPKNAAGVLLRALKELRDKPNGFTVQIEFDDNTTTPTI